MQLGTKSGIFELSGNLELKVQEEGGGGSLGNTLEGRVGLALLHRPTLSTGHSSLP